MRIHTIIHAPFEKPGIIESWAKDKGYPLPSTHIYRAEALPQASQFDLLIIMGGPQSPTELDQYPYLQDEITLAQQAIEQKKGVLGICLGAQIISEALGTKTSKSPNKEVGLFPIELTAEGKKDPVFKMFPPSFDVMHWHNDMPGIAKDGVLLAASEGCPHQAIRYGDRVYALQCHMEMTPDLVKGMIKNCPSDLAPGKYIQDIENLLAIEFTDMNRKMIYLLNYFATLLE